MNVFDLLARQTVDTITRVMGDRAVWHKSKTETVEALVLFNDPTEPVQIGETEKYAYRPANATAEYYEDVFKGLKKSVDSKRIPQFMTVKGRKYLIVEVTTKYDGKMCVAHLEPYKKDEVQ